MKITITERSLAKQGLTIKDFGILMYYMGGGNQNLVPEITKKLLKKNLITNPSLDIYEYNKDRDVEIRSWYINGNSHSEPERFESLALKMMNLFPKGSKCAGHPWRSNKVTVAQKLSTLHYKFSVDLDEEKVLAATKRYIDSFHGNYQYMQCLNYFILKRDLIRMEDMSALSSYLEQGEDVEKPTGTTHFDSGEII